MHRALTPSVGSLDLKVISLSTGLGMSGGVEPPGADSPWLIGKGRPPDSTLTADLYRAIGSFVGAVELGQTLGQRVQTLFFAPTLAEHRANVTVAGLSKLLSECEVAVEGWLQAICKYLGTTNTPEIRCAATYRPRPAL